jgi:hypothetical protein
MTQFSASNIDLAGNGWFANKTNYWTQSKPLRSSPGPKQVVAHGVRGGEVEGSHRTWEGASLCYIPPTAMLLLIDMKSAAFWRK